MNNSIRYFITVLLILNIAGIGCKTKNKSQVDSSTKPNVLFIVAEDMSPWMGSYGYPDVKTPNLDEFAEEALLFENAHSNVPLCNPSRASFLTGLRPETTGILENFQDWRNIVADSILTMPAFFKQQGYTSIRVGKAFHNLYRDTLSWSEIYDPPGKTPVNRKLKQPEKDITIPPDTAQMNDTIVLDYINRSLKWGVSTEDETTESDYQKTTLACKQMQKKRGNPFYMLLGFSNTHLPIMAPQKYVEMYDPNTIQLPDVPEDDLEDVPNEAFWLFNTLDEGRVNETEIREIRAHFYATISFLDANVGRVIDCMKDNDMYENTIVVFISDHGFMLGEHQLWRKETLFEASTAVPLIMKALGKSKPEGRSQNVVELVDFYSTLASLSGLKAPGYVEGTDFSEVFDNPQLVKDTVAYSLAKVGDINNNDVLGRSVRTTNFRYTEWGKDPQKAELYDHRSDPTEYNNLVNNSDYQAIKQDLRELLYVNE